MSCTGSAKRLSLHPGHTHPDREHFKENRKHPDPAAFAKRWPVFPVRREHVDDLHLPDGPGVGEAHHQETENEKSRRQQHGVRKQRPGDLILLSIGGEQQRRDELGAEHPQKDAGGNGHQPHEEGFREEEPADGPLLHPHDGLEGKLPLFPAEHIVVDEADQKQQDQSDGADGQLHAVAEHGEVILRPNIRLVVAAGDGEEGVEQGDADSYSQEVDQVVLDRPPGVSEDELSIHGSPLLPAESGHVGSSQRRRSGCRCPYSIP